MGELMATLTPCPAPTPQGRRRTPSRSPRGPCSSRPKDTASWQQVRADHGGGSACPWSSRMRFAPLKYLESESFKGAYKTHSVK